MPDTVFSDVSIVGRQTGLSIPGRMGMALGLIGLVILLEIAMLRVHPQAHVQPCTHEVTTTLSQPARTGACHAVTAVMGMRG